MQLITILIVVVPVLVAVGFVLVIVQSRKQAVNTAASATSVSAARGLMVAPGPETPPPLPFDVFQGGRSHLVANRMWDPHAPDASVFEHRYSERRAGNEWEPRRHVCAVLPLPFDAPRLWVGPAGRLSNLLAKVGGHDIAIGWPEFDEQFIVQSADEAFARTLLDPATAALLLREQFPLGPEIRLHMELIGRSMIVWTNYLIDPERFPDLLAWGRHLVASLPAVLAERYPPFPQPPLTQQPFPPPSR